MAPTFLAVSPIQIVDDPSWASRPSLYTFNTSLNLAEDADVVSVHEDCGWGVPWNSFLYGETTHPFPKIWLDHLDALEAAIAGSESGEGVWPSRTFLSLGMLNGGASGRSCPSYNVTETSSSVPFSTCGGGDYYDFDPKTNPDAGRIRSAFADYAVYMTGRLAPTGFVNFGTEMNIYDDAGDDVQWAAVVDFANEVYAAVKAAFPEATVFPSFQAEFLKGTAKDSMPCHGLEDTTACEIANLARVSGVSRDAFALSVYGDAQGAGFPPSRHSGNFTGYLESLFQKLPTTTEPLVVAETGWLTTNLTVNTALTPLGDDDCETMLISDMDLAKDWMDYLLSNFAVAGMPFADRFALIAWWSDADLMPAQITSTCPACPAEECALEEEMCQLIEVFRLSSTPSWTGEFELKVFGAMGLRDYFGQETSLMDTWRAHCAFSRTT